jgi:hypothetical protein
VTTSAEHVLEAIDNCLRDYSVSEDAMRWAPDGEAAADSPAGQPHAAPGRTFDRLTRAYAEFCAGRALLFGSRGECWVMDLAAYISLRREAGDESDPATWLPDPGDQVFGIPIEVREGCGDPRIEARWSGMNVTGLR